MKRFYAEIAPPTASWSYKYFDSDAVLNVIRENNQAFSIWFDSISGRIFCECEEKPRNMPFYGVFWKEEETQNDS